MAAIRLNSNYWGWSSKGLDSDYNGTVRQASVPGANDKTPMYWWASDRKSVVVSAGNRSSKESSTTTEANNMELPQSQPAVLPEVNLEREIEEAGRQSISSDIVQHSPSYDEAAEDIPITLIEPELYRGATIGDRGIFEEILRHQEGIDRIAKLVTPQKNTVLHVAASFGQLQIVQMVHTHCPSLDRKTNSRGDTALHHAARDGHLSVVKFLVKNFTGDIETGTMEVSEGLLRMKNVDGNTALHEATRNGHAKVAQLLIEQDHELANMVNFFGESPFYLAAEAGLTVLVAELSLLPLDHMIQDGQDRKTALHAAISQEHTDTVKILLGQIPKLRETRDIHGRSPLHYAAYCGNLEAITLLLRDDVSIAHHKDKDGNSPIHLACFNGHLTVFQELLKQCPDSRELLNNKLQNALHVASENRRDNMVSFILENPELEKLINERDIDGNTPLHLATRYAHATIVTALVRHKGVDLTIKNNDSHTAYEVAEMHATSQFSFQKILSAVALKSASAPRRHRRLFFKRHVQETPGDEKATMESFRDRISTLVLVATLIITITFAAGLVLPGEDKKGDGEKQLHSALHVYVISNTIAMYSSIVAAIMLIWAHLGDPNLLDFALRWSMLILAVALTMLAVAFAAGVYLVVSEFAWLAAAVLIMSFVYLLCILALFIPLQAPIVPKYRWMRFISKFTLNFLLFATGFEQREWWSE